MKYFAVIGHPVAHSRSPIIHQAFAKQFGHEIAYARLHAGPGGFADVLEAFRAGGGHGVNVTLPFKLDAYAICSEVSDRAKSAAAVNTIAFGKGGTIGDNTDGLGLVDDLSGRLGLTLEGLRVLICGAGGATRGVIAPLFEAGCSHIRVVNRDVEKAKQLCFDMNNVPHDARLDACSYSDLHTLKSGHSFDIVINATSTGLGGQRLDVPDAMFSESKLAYDMVYAAKPTVFMQQAFHAGCAESSDGLGMLVGQAAHAYALWHGVMPDTAQVYKDLRAAIDGQ